MTDTTKTVFLKEPFEDRWVKVQTEVKMRVWIDVNTKVLAAFRSPDLESIGACLEACKPLIVEHNLVDVETGEPVDFSFQEMSSGQIRGILGVLVEVFLPGGEPADPLAPTKSEPVSSPKRSSTKRRSRSASPSGSSPTATP